MTTGIVFDIKKFSIHDGPGIRTTVFLKGCPLSCWWCHNPEGQAQHPELILRPQRCIGCGACVNVCERGAILPYQDSVTTDRGQCTVCGACVPVCWAEAREIVGREMTVAEVMDEVERDSAFYEQSGGGVTFSGGEPLTQPDLLRQLLRACQERGFHTALDTCGFAPWDVLEDIRKDVDLFLYDLKLIDDERHREMTGVSNAIILENLRRLSQYGQRMVIRVPIIPGVNADERTVQAIGAFAVALPSLDYVDLLPYHRIGRDKYRRLGKRCPMPETDPPSKERMDGLAQRLRELGVPVKVQSGANQPRSRAEILSL